MSYTLGQAVQGDTSHFQRDNRNVSISVLFQSNGTVNEIILADCCENKVWRWFSIRVVVCAEPCQNKQELKVFLGSIRLQFTKLTHSLPVSWLLLWTSDKENEQKPNWSDTYLAFSLRTRRRERRRRQLNPAAPLRHLSGAFFTRAAKSNMQQCWSRNSSFEGGIRKPHRCISSGGPFSGTYSILGPECMSVNLSPERPRKKNAVG